MKKFATISCLVILLFIITPAEPSLTLINTPSPTVTIYLKVHSGYYTECQQNRWECEKLYWPNNKNPPDEWLAFVAFSISHNRSYSIDCIKWEVDQNGQGFQVWNWNREILKIDGDYMNNEIIKVRVTVRIDDGILYYEETSNTITLQHDDDDMPTWNNYFGLGATHDVCGQ